MGGGEGRWPNRPVPPPTRCCFPLWGSQGLFEVIFSLCDYFTLDADLFLFFLFFFLVFLTGVAAGPSTLPHPLSTLLFPPAGCAGPEVWGATACCRGIAEPQILKRRPGQTGPRKGGLGWAGRLSISDGAGRAKGSRVTGSPSARGGQVVAPSPFQHCALVEEALTCPAPQVPLF